MNSLRTLSVLLAGLAGFGLTPASGAVISGTLTSADAVGSHLFSLIAQTTVTIQTYSFGGGVLLSNGGLVPAGGFDPIVSLFQEVGGAWVLSGSNDDGLCPVGIPNPYCGDSTLTLDLLTGNYMVTVTASANAPIGPTLADGFTGGGSLAGVTADYAADLLFTAVPEPATGPLVALVAALGWAVRRRRTALLNSALFAVCALPMLATDWNVPPGGNLQGILDAAQLGDNIILRAGATYTGSFVARPKTGTGWITIRTDSAALLARPGRVSPADAADMPKIVMPANAPAFDFADGGHHYRLIGLEFKPAAGVYVFEILRIGLFETTVGQMTHDIAVDRCYLHGDPTVGGKNGVVVNALNFALTNSYLSGFTATDQETHALVSWTGGPYQIVNNYLEASGICLLFGGARTYVPGGIASDVQILRNHMKKQLSWKPSDPSYGGIPYISKNLLEIKNGQRFVVDGNVMENSWFPVELGRAIVLAPFTEDGLVPWARVEDIRITRNIMKNLGVGLLIYGQDIYTTPFSGYARGILFQDNIMSDVLESNSLAGSGGYLAVVHTDVRDLKVIHNTYHGDGQWGIFGLTNPRGVTAAPSGFRFEYNLVRNNRYGVYDGTGNIGTAVLNAGAPGYVFRENVLEGGRAVDYPVNNFFPANLAEIKFANLPLRDLRLTPASPYFRRGSDGKDLGADVEAVYLATKGVVAGTGGRCVTSITPAVLNFGPAGGTGTITVNAPAGCAWFTSIAPSWLTINSGFSSVGPGSVQIAVPASSGGSRATTVIVDGLKSVIRQN